MTEVFKTQNRFSNRLIAFFQSYYRQLIAFTITICLVRIFEYFTVAPRLFVTGAFRFELKGLLYDVWACLIYGFLFLIVMFLFSLVHKRLAIFVFHLLNVLFIIMYLSLLVVFTERTRPFDHEFFTRSAADSWTTSKQMLASGFSVYIPFLIFISLYFIFYFLVLRRATFQKYSVVILTVLLVIGFSTINFAMPAQDKFAKQGEYYLECNKFSFWVSDCFKYLTTANKATQHPLNNKELEAEILYYQQQHPFQFTGTEYPLMHQNKVKDVLGGFFNLNPNPPNIVILVVEGLSRDFSGDKAYATSFTPFLDSLSSQSLTWDNFLSTAPGTFAAHPAISGSLPYGRRGFSLINVMPAHLSLIRILRRNGYRANFMIGFNPDFDNMGGYIRLQGTDLILSDYPAKYKEMGIGSEGWSMGYPDDALYSRSFEVLDSLKQTPYLDIYHTGTTHMPYLFEQKPKYDRLFDEKMKTISVAPSIKKTLRACKKVLVTFMFSDDCIKQFFADYKKRPEYSNTIFFITGDHHIGSFPSTGNIDDYHVPLIIYSPMLKAPEKFYSVNSHNNLAPTITNLLFANYKMKYQPAEVNWMADVMDTCASFRNIQSMPFMAWSREMNDYIYKDYMLSEGSLYKLTPELIEEPYKNDSVKKYLTRLLDNFKIINAYVCDSNKIYPEGQDQASADKVLLKSFAAPGNSTIFTQSSDTTLFPDFNVTQQYRYLYVETSADVLLSTPDTEDQPAFQMGLVERKGWDKNYLYWTNRDIVLMTKTDYKPGQWNHVSTNDMFPLSGYKNKSNVVFELGLYTQKLPMSLKMKDLQVNIYGVK